MRTVFLGTSDFALGVLERLSASAHRPALVVTRPDRPRGRGRKTASPPVADGAREIGVPLFQPESVNSETAIAEIDGAAPESVIVCAFGALIKEPLLSRHPMLNVHPSLLPRWRGAAPIERAIIAGDTETGVCVMRLTAGLDSGPICLSASEPITEDDDYGALATRLCALGGELIVQALDRAEAGPPLDFSEQDDAQATYAEKIAPEDRLLDPNRAASELARTVRALHPHIGARLGRPDGSALGVLRATALPAADSPAEDLPAADLPAADRPAEDLPAADLPAEDLPADIEAGALLAVDGRLLLGTSEGILELLEIQPPGGLAMDAEAYLRGHAL